MTTKPKKKNKSKSMAFLERLNDGPLTFAQLFCAIREGEEMTQEDFGRLLGISRQKICDIEKGRRLPSPDKAAEYAKMLGYYPESFAKIIIEEQIKKAGLKLKIVDAA